MAYTYNVTLLLGTSQTGLAATLRAALRATDGTIHASLRDISTGFIEDGAGVYGWVSSAIPDGYRGRVVFYTGTLGALATDFSGVVVKTAASISPEEVENTDVKTSSIAAMISDPLESEVPNDYAQGTAGYALGRLGEGVVTVVAAVSPDGSLNLTIGDSYTLALGRALEWTDEDVTWPTLTGAVIDFEIDDGRLEKAGSIVVATGAGKKVRVELTSEETGTLIEGSLIFSVIATFSTTERVTLVKGIATVVGREDV